MNATLEMWVSLLGGVEFWYNFWAFWFVVGLIKIFSIRFIHSVNYGPKH